MSAVRSARVTALVAVVLLLWTGFVPATAFAQRAQPRGGAASGGGDRSSGGGGDRSGGGKGGSVRTTAPREGPRTAPRSSAPRETPREASGTAPAPAEPAASSGATSNESSPRTATAVRRARGDNPTVGHAVDRRGPPPSAWDDHDDHYYSYYPYSYYPYSYYPGYWYGGFYPWGYGGFGLGYYGSWYGGYGYGSGSSYYGWGDDGSIRLKVKPREASVFVDGYYVGRVDDFDGVFQRLHLEPGPHRIEVRADSYEPLSFEVRILPDRKITYEEALQPQR